MKKKKSGTLGWKKRGRAACRLTCQKERAWRCVCVCEEEYAPLQILIAPCESHALRAIERYVYATQLYYLALPPARCCICIVLIKDTYTPIQLSLSITPSVHLALVKDFTCSEGCFPSFLDTDCLQWFFIICLHHWTLFFSTHADSLAARVLHSALIHRVWNYLQKKFPPLKFQGEDMCYYCCTENECIPQSGFCSRFSLVTTKHTRLDSKNVIVFPM